jgi:hypothetical protein
LLLLLLLLFSHLDAAAATAPLVTPPYEADVL